MMYLVCLEYVFENMKENDTFIWKCIRLIQGPIYHVELIFVKDRIADALMVSVYCPGGFPIFIKDRSYSDKERRKITYYKLNNVSVEKENEMLRMVEKIVSEKQYKMSTTSMIGSSLPGIFKPYFEFIFNILVNILREPSTTRDDAVESYIDFKTGQDTKTHPIYCVTLTKLILDKIYQLDENVITDETNCTDLICILESKLKLITKMETPPLLWWHDTKHYNFETLNTYLKRIDYLL
jgi:predicted esterase YcpF (UPF0227 family)